MLVKELMSSPVITVRPGTSLKEATQLLEHHAITAMPVIDGHGDLVGVISEADVIQDAVLEDPRAHVLPVRLTSGPRATRVADVMSHHVLSVPVQADVAEAANLMIGTAVKSLPVVDDGHVVGMVSRRDIVRVLARRDESIEVEIDELVRLSGENWNVEVNEGVVIVDGPETNAERELAQVLVCTVPGVVGIYIRKG